MAVGNMHGTTVAWTTSTALNALKVVELDPRGPSIGMIRTSHLGTTGAHTYSANTLKEEGEFSITYQFDPSVVIPAVGTSDTVLIAFGGAGSTNESSGPVIIQSVKPGTITVDQTELATVVITCKCSDDWTDNQN